LTFCTRREEEEKRRLTFCTRREEEEKRRTGGKSGFARSTDYPHIA
jgi:hypothetical protein